MTTEPTSGVMHFSVDGDWLCGIVRDTVLSERWDSAMRILREVQGLTREQEEGILTGELTLLSDLSDIVPLDEERKTAYQTSFAYIYAGRVRLGGGLTKGWWRPAACVVDFGRNDLDERSKATLRQFSLEAGDVVQAFRSGNTHDFVLDDTYKMAAKSMWERRAAHYALQGEVAVLTRRAVVSGCPCSCAVIFEACDAPPSWLTPPADATAAVEQALAAGRPIESRGHTVWYPNEKKSGLGPYGADYSYANARRVRAEQKARELHTYRTGDPATDAMIDTMPNAMALDAITAHDRGVESLVAQGKRRATADRLEEKRLEELAWAEQDEARRRELSILHQKVLDQGRATEKWAAWRRFTTEAGETYAVLRGPFDRYVLENRERLSPGSVDPTRAPWTPVSPYGLKLMNDDPFHSDWLLSMERGVKGQDDGFYWSTVFADDPNRWYTEVSRAEDGTPLAALRFALYRLQNAVEDFYLRGGPDPLDMKPDPEPVRPIVLRLSGYIGAPRGWTGIVAHPDPDEEVPEGSILVVPHLGPEFYIPAASAGPAGVVIAGAGGETAHLAQVAQDHAGGFPALVVYPGAVAAFPPGSWVEVNVGPGSAVTIERRTP